MSNPLEDFLTIEKQATTPPTGFMHEWRGQGGLSGAAGRALPGAMVMAGAAAAGSMLHSGFRALHDRLTKARDYKAMLQATPDLRHFDAGHTQMMYNSLRSLAPTLARDPLVAGSFVRDALRLSPEHGPAIAPQTAKMLVDTQSKLQQEGVMGHIQGALGGVKVPGPMKHGREAE